MWHADVLGHIWQYVVVVRVFDTVRSNVRKSTGMHIINSNVVCYIAVRTVRISKQMYCSFLYNHYLCIMRVVIIYLRREQIETLLLCVAFLVDLATFIVQTCKRSALPCHTLT